MGNLSPTVSIIVPVYNAMESLRRCVDSILHQSYPDYELLLVDDGSRDGSGALCDDYAAQDTRIRVIHQENAGVSAARNRALDQARGTYLQFLDSDDWITPDATGLLVRAAGEQQCDLVIADFYRVVGERVSHKGDIGESAVLSREEYAARMMEQPADFYYGVLWNKLYRRAIVEAHHLRMNEELSWCEDFMFNLEYIRHAERFYALQVPIYYYVKTKGSLTVQGLSFSKSIRMKLEAFSYYNQFYKSVLDEEEYEKSRLKVYRFLVDAAGDGTVPPVSKRLGNERITALPDHVAGEGLLADGYRERKLLEQCLETASLQHNLSLPEGLLLLYLSQTDWLGSRRDLAEVIGVPYSVLSLAMKKLSAKSFLEIKELRSRQEGQRVQLTLTEKAEPSLVSLEEAREVYEQTRLAGLTREEQDQYAALNEKIRNNVRKTLGQGGHYGN